MQPRTLQQIIAELNPTYQPQADALRQRQSLIPQAIQSEEAALGAKADQAYEGILSGARRRGLGFSGIPVGEQAKYAATEYTPALARLRQSGQEQAISLEEAILGINERRDQLANQIYQTEQDRAFQMQEAEKNRRASAAAASSSGAGLASLFAAAGGGSASDPADQLKTAAAGAVQELLGRRGTRSFYEEVQAIAKSAGYGNQVDQAKLELLRATQPGLFKDNNLNAQRITSELQRLSQGPVKTAPGPGLLSPSWATNRLKSNAGIFKF